LFRIATWGESHGPGVGVVIDGCPPRVALSVEDVQFELDRRRPGQSRLTTQRREEDRVTIVSGVLDGVTLGTPIAMMVQNTDTRAKDYDELKDAYRPSHADFTYDAKYGIRAVAGGGRASARETVGRVAAGAVAKVILAQAGIEVLGWVQKVHQLQAVVDPLTVTLADVEKNIVRCPDEKIAADMEQAIDSARKAGDSLGGVVEAVARGVPPGLGEPVFDKLEADLAKAMLSLPACKGFEVGSGFAGTDMKGSEHNDAFIPKSGQSWKIGTRTNRSGGIQGGISNGEAITLRAAFKPTATILLPQDTVTRAGEPIVYKGRGRHDPCVLPRAVPLVEAMFRLVLVDHLLRHRAQCG
jgi:chorismate synthase